MAQGGQTTARADRRTVHYTCSTEFSDMQITELLGHGDFYSYLKRRPDRA